MDTVWQAWDEQKATLLADSNMKAMVTLVDATVRALPDILSGKVLATDIIFPDSSMELVEGVYKQNQVADYFNEVLADTLVAYIQECLKSEPGMALRILEIGAGTGGTSVTVFQKLKSYQDYIQEYCYSDVSRAFLLHAEREYGPYNPYLTYRIFNVETPIIEQDIAAGSYDVVIAANVLHATKDIRQTLRNAKAVLKNNGLLLLNEINSNNIFSHLTFGLLEGWWRYEDPALRIAGCPSLYPETWRRVLENEGFRDVSFMAEEDHDLGQQIIVAESDGVIRHRKQPKAGDIAVKPVAIQHAQEEISYNHGPHVLQEEKSSAHALPAKPEIYVPISDDLLAGRTLQFIKETLAKAIKLSPERIEADASFEKYGIDSILQVNFIRELEKVTGDLPKTILFEYSNAQELVEYLIKNHTKKLREWISPPNNAAPPVPEASVSVTPAVQVASFSVKPDRFLASQQVERTNQEQNAQIQQGNERTQETDDIAIIGISGRYPLSNTLEELWEHLKAGQNCITEVATDRWKNSFLNRLSKDRPRKTDTKYYGGFLASIDRFDYQLFEVNRQQVMEMAPEIRLFLEVVWETFENAGYSKFRLNELQSRQQKGVGVFVGNMYNQYFLSIPSLEQAVLSSNGTDWHIANRISHFFNLTGPSLAISSACSSSLTAIHLACESLKQQSCSMAIAGGINLALDPSKYAVLQRAHLLGSGNESKSFGISDGFIPGEGVGSVLLKPLSRAIQDHDHIYAVIKSSSVNHSGGRQMYAAPDPKQQAQLITNSIWQSGIDPTTIGYVESAANGSELGDSIEVIALQQAFAHYTEKKQFCALGSVKSNLGHLEAASGVSQLSKVLLQMEHATLVPSINAKPINPNIKLEKTAFYLQQATEPWKQPLDSRTGKNLPRRSMINSFGAGGSYANLIIEEYIADPVVSLPSSASSQESLFIFSARTPWSLRKYLEKMRIFLRKNPFLDMGDIARSLQKLNHGLEHRVAILSSSIDDLIVKLDTVQTASTGVQECDIYTSFDHTSSHVDVTDAFTILQLLEKKNLRQVARHWVAGARIDFKPLYKIQGTAWVDLPHYVFDHQMAFRFVDDHVFAEDEHDEEPAPYRSDKVPAIVTTAGDKKHRILERYAYDDPYLKGHQMNGEQVLIGATYGSLAVKAFFHLFPDQHSICMRNLTYIEPVAVNENQQVEVKVESLQKGTTTAFQVLYRHTSADAWKPTATGQYEKAPFEGRYCDIQHIQSTLQEFQDVDRIYKRGKGLVEWGDIFKRITCVYIGPDQVLAHIDCAPGKQEDTHTYELNPLITNTAYLAMMYVLEQAHVEGGFLPFSINEIQFAKNKTFTNGWLHIKLVKISGEVVIFDVDAINEVSEVVVCYTGYALKRNYIASNTRESKEGSGSRMPELQHPMPPSYANDTSSMNDIARKIMKYLSDKLSNTVADTAQLCDIEVSWMELGLDSSRLLAMTHEIEEETKIELNSTLLFEYPNIKELTEFFAREHAEIFIQLLERAPVEKSNRLSIEQIRKEFPELVHLNRKYQGQPVFWFHAGQGGVEIYQTIAQRSPRPFYGIRARGYMDNQVPIRGIKKMATYYIDIMRSVQPEGPYDVGGYSLGGMVAYEITRQLQQAGQKVNTMVMIDVPGGPIFREQRPSAKSLILQAVNTMLSSLVKDAEQWDQHLISVEEIDLNSGDEAFLKKMISLANARGLTKTKTQIRNQIQQNVRLQRAYDIANYIALPLPDAKAVDCYYLRNSSGVFLGVLEPYLTIPNDKIALDRTAYWEEWERLMPDFHIIDIDASNHMMMLSEARAVEAIAEFCESFYVGREIYASSL
ncbi:hypothetical protein KDW_41100 [Dictyobacter vulcani]|uniref:Polyketide synthase n=1 Tax=Dictyobacter vulcani TaxID=2607529 RepID=A0A5J4KJP9_9CHLR|nr:hypothetical protein KDW_41100 [Dictyobacter vulcani]